MKTCRCRLAARLIVALLFIEILSFSSRTLRAQTVPASIQFTSDTTAIISLGNNPDSVRNALSVTILFHGDFRGIKPNTFSKVFLNSFVTTGGNTGLASLGISSDSTIAYLKVLRTDSSPFSGYGDVLRLGGVDIVVLQDIGKNSEGLEASVQVSLQSEGWFSLERDYLVLFPNPMQEYICLSGMNLECKKWCIVDHMGQSVGEGMLGLEPCISLQGLPAGMYLLQILGQSYRFQKI